ncbi:MAG: hypothetical protein FGF53_08460 [Candidatus Brockarchaeota archaeon]|nr:hypothetical protein [Candidatus Brockarchaeota archaeon]MBO3808948.1 hypothetical protein [Candidatus Brockarchaeota archaeon]MBO3842597.1 hypothetical protein [Candidatus Brockarchaeota archaeon]
MSWSESEEELLRYLKAELKKIREKKDVVIGQDAYTLLCKKERTLMEEISKLYARRQVAQQTAKVKTPL